MKKFFEFVLLIIVVLMLLLFFAYPQLWDRVRSLQQKQAEPAKQESGVQQTAPPKTQSGGKLEVSSPCTGPSIAVCGQDHKTYASECLAAYLGVKVVSQGACPKIVQ